LLRRVYRLGTAILALSSNAPTTTFYTLRNGNYGANLTRFTLPGGLARISHSGFDFRVTEQEGMGEHMRKVAVVG